MKAAGPALLFGALLVASSALPAAAAPSWAEVKCGRYRDAWTAALARRGRDGLSSAFVESHEAFLRSGCTEGRNVCPRAPAEFEMANVLTILAMNAGAASTFLPFACPRNERAP